MAPFHEQTAYNKRQILFCDGRAETCVKKISYMHNKKESGSYVTNLTQIQLVTTQMFLTRKRNSVDSLNEFEGNCGKGKYNDMQ